MSDQKNIASAVPVSGEEQIRLWLQEFGEGGVDREAEALVLAEAEDIEEDWVRTSFAGVREARAAVAAAAPVVASPAGETLRERGRRIGREEAGRIAAEEAKSFSVPPIQPEVDFD